MNSRENWVLKVDPDVYKDVSRFPQAYARKILGVVESLSGDPYGGDIERVKGDKKKLYKSLPGKNCSRQQKGAKDN